MFSSKNQFLTGAGGYQIQRSVRLRSSASAYLIRTFSSGSSNQIRTLSCWVKRGALTVSGNATIMGCYDGTSAVSAQLYFNASDQLVFDSGGAASVLLTTSQVFRDPSAWYHIVLVVDTTQATASNRQKLYVNGVQVTSFSAANYPGLGAASQLITASANNKIGTWWNSTAFFDGYLTEINFIDGLALTPSSFGQTNTVTGVWQPLKYTGAYGINGFYLNFSDNSAATAAAIGKDYSGNGNNWTPNNISVTAGVTYDSMIDVPTLFADGGTGRGNYAVLNPVNGSQGTVSNGNLTYASTGNSTGFQTRIGTLASLSTGKWYFETTITAASASTGDPLVGWVNDSFNIASTNADGSSTAWCVKWQFPSGSSFKQNGATVTSIFTGNAVGDVIMIAVDLDAAKIWIGRNGTWSESGNPATATNPQFSNLSGGPFSPFVRGAGGTGATSTLDSNFGQRPFSYTPPTGFIALNTQNLPTPTISKGNQYFDATIYTGNGSSQSVVNSGGMQPDLVWIKTRSVARDHRLVDSVRGATNELYPNLTFAAATDAAGLTAFNSNGFTVGASVGYNNTGETLIGWQWNAGGATIANTAGSITSQVRASPTSGFSIVTYTGTGANATVGHGLGVAPKMVIVKRRDTTADWSIWHTAIPAANYLVLNQTIASTSAPTVWNSTAPTSTVFTVGTSTNTNASAGTHVAYCFTDVAGFSKFGSYTGNGSTDGPFVYCGFRPRWLLLKVSSAAGFDWLLYDSSRNTYNVTNLNLRPDLSDAEGSQTANNLDFLSNGFKIRGDSTGSINPAQTIIYAAFAENPFKNSLAR